MYCEGNVGIRLLAACVVFDMPLGRDAVHRPLLVRRDVIHSVSEAVVVAYVQLVAAVCPRNEGDLALLAVKGEVLYVEGAIGLYQGRVQPKNVSIGTHDGVRDHVVVEFVASAATANTTTFTTVQCNHTFV